MNLAQCRFCISRYPQNQMFEGKCPECQVEHLKFIALDEHNKLQQIANRPTTAKESPTMPNMRGKTMPRDAAILQAARELAETPGVTLTQVLVRAQNIRGAGISTGYLSPTGQGYHIRPQVEAILGITPKPVENARQALATAPQVVTDLQAENERLRAELEAARATPAPATTLVIEAAIRKELERDKATLSRICAEIGELQERLRELAKERASMAAQVAMLSDLHQRYSGEPTQPQHLRLVGGDVA